MDTIKTIFNLFNEKTTVQARRELAPIIKERQRFSASGVVADVHFNPQGLLEVAIGFREKPLRGKTVFATFSDSSVYSELEELTKNQPIELEGVVADALSGSTFLTDCNLVRADNGKN